MLNLFTEKKTDDSNFKLWIVSEIDYSPLSWPSRKTFIGSLEGPVLGLPSSKVFQREKFKKCVLWLRSP